MNKKKLLLFGDNVFEFDVELHRQMYNANVIY